MTTDTKAIYATAVEYLGTEQAATDFMDNVLRRLEDYRATSGATCTRCYRHQPLDAYGIDATRPDGLRRVCLECDRTLAALRRARENGGRA